jgi:uncharacterized membrane protein
MVKKLQKNSYYKKTAKANISKQNSDLMLVGVGTMIASAILGIATASVASFFIAGAIEYGVYKVFYLNSIGEKIMPVQALHGFKDKYGESFIAGFVTELLRAIPKWLRILTIISTLFSVLTFLNVADFGQSDKYINLGEGLSVITMLVSLLTYIVLLQYAMAQYILLREQDIQALHALRKSRMMMSGYVFKYFALRLSFLGWAMLASLTLGISNIYSRAYFYASEVAFFNDVYEAFKDDESGQEILNSMQDDEEDNTIGGIYIG